MTPGPTNSHEHRKLHLRHSGAQFGLQDGKVLVLQLYELVLEGLQELRLLAEVTDLLGLDELG